MNYEQVAAAKILSSRECLGQVRDIKKRYLVSNEVAARSVIETHSGLGICAFIRSATNQRKRLWGLSSLNGISPRYPQKQIKLSSIKDEMVKWCRDLLDRNILSSDLDFATESSDQSKYLIVKTADHRAGTVASPNGGQTERFKVKSESERIDSQRKIELAAIMLIKPPADL